MKPQRPPPSVCDRKMSVYVKHQLVHSLKAVSRSVVVDTECKLSLCLFVAGSLEKFVSKLEEVYKNELLKTVYAGVNRKEVDDPDLQPFFKFKCWI